jgi:hypothetical protein
MTLPRSVSPNFEVGGQKILQNESQHAPKTTEGMHSSVRFIDSETGADALKKVRWIVSRGSILFLILNCSGKTSRICGVQCNGLISNGVLPR